MSSARLAELTASAAAADDPGFAPEGVSRFGGVDPLGLRQINFDLMDELLLGLNNVAHHIRPFVVVTWAWRRAHQCAQSLGVDSIRQGDLQDFVDRIEVIYVWSQLLRDPNVDLPGKDFLAPLLSSSTVAFSGPTWEQRRKTRRYSTALSAPIYYGPGLKALGWLQPHPSYPAVMVPRSEVAPALDAFEARMRGMLDHDAFKKFGAVTVSRDEARSWADCWAMDGITEAEGQVMREILVGAASPSRRRRGAELMLAAADFSSTNDVPFLRAAMTGPPSDFHPEEHLWGTRNMWRRLQVRQLFRLSLEALFYWTLGVLPETSGSIDAVVRAFVDKNARPPDITSAGAWIASLLSATAGPTELMTRIVAAFDESSASDLAPSVAAGLALCLSEPPDAELRAQQHDRLPLYRAQQEATARADGSVEDLVRHMLESWVLAQHTYWSVGRGLADARARGKTLLRLKIILDEGGWAVTPGAPRGRPPQPTPDRLQTLVSLSRECGLLANAVLVVSAEPSSSAG